jgi:hypothetical protein
MVELIDALGLDTVATNLQSITSDLVPDVYSLALVKLRMHDCCAS